MCRRVHDAQPGVAHGADVIRPGAGGAGAVGPRRVHHARHAGQPHDRALRLAAEPRQRPAREVRALPRPPRVHVSIHIHIHTYTITITLLLY